MSQENVEVVRESMRRFEAFDFDGAAQLWHPEGRVTGPDGWPEPGPFEGRDAVIQQFQRLAADWKQHRMSDVRVVIERGEWVVVTFRWEALGGKSGATTEANFAAAYRIEHGQMREAHFRWTAEQALEAAGLRE
jgi:ketosteroid isomerase-like protein